MPIKHTSSWQLYSPPEGERGGFSLYIPPKYQEQQKEHDKEEKAVTQPVKSQIPPFVQASAGCAGGRLTNTTQKI